MFDAPGGDGARRHDGAGELRDAARDTAQAAWDDVRGKAREQAHEGKRSAARGLGDLADALHDAAGRLEDEEHPQIARFAHTAAGSLERVADTLHGRDLDGLVHDAEAFARRQPLTFFAGAVAAGFLAVRFLKSSERAREDDESVRHHDAADPRHSTERHDDEAHARHRGDDDAAPVAPLDVDESTGGGGWAELPPATPRGHGAGRPTI
jgi:hypothetical protein